ncbi:MAG: hypothetical protein R2752_13995 [Vicinamibacterales bacterium]
MARGWESKSVEAQQAERESRGTRADGPASPEARARLARRRTVELALARARADLEVATRPGHRDMLVRAIETLEQQLAAEADAARTVQ